jgi:hypothetical protein
VYYGILWDKVVWKKITKEKKMIQVNKVPNTDQDYIDLKKQCESQDSIFKDISLENFKKIVQNYIKINSDTIGLTN